MTFDTLPPHIDNDTITNFGSSSFVRNGKLHRNLDWYYSNTAEFWIRFKDVEGMAFLDGLEDGHLEGRDQDIGQLPYRLCDGHNEKTGLMVSTHVLNNDWHFPGSGAKNISCTMLPFYVLTTMTDINTLSDEVNNLLENVKVSEALLIQVLVSNGTTTKLFTPDENGYKYIDITSNPKLTNFNWVNRKIITIF